MRRPSKLFFLAGSHEPSSLLATVPSVSGEVAIGVVRVFTLGVYGFKS